MTTYASKTPRDLNHDPHPWAVYVWPHPPRINASMRYATKDETERQAFGSYVHGFYPRPEFDHVQHNEPNPILVYLRDAMTRPGSEGLVLAYVAEEQLYSIREAEQFGAVAAYGFPATREHVAHARRVLERLASPAAIGEGEDA